MIERFCWWWLERRYRRIDVEDCEIADDIVINLPRLRLETETRTSGTTLSVNI